MTKAEVLKTIKEVNQLIERQEDKNQANDMVELLLDSITIYNPCWKFYKQFDLHLNRKTGKYFVTFN